MDMRGIKRHTAPKGSDSKQTLSKLIKYMSINTLLKFLLTLINVQCKPHYKSLDVNN